MAERVAGRAAPIEGHPYTAGEKWFGLKSVDRDNNPAVHVVRNTKSKSATYFYNWQIDELYAYVARHWNADLQHFHDHATPADEDALFRLLWPTRPGVAFTADEVEHLKKKAKRFCDVTRKPHDKRPNFRPEVVRSSVAEVDDAVRRGERPHKFPLPSYFAAHQRAPPEPSASTVLQPDAQQQQQEQQQPSPAPSATTPSLKHPPQLERAQPSHVGPAISATPPRPVIENGSEVREASGGDVRPGEARDCVGDALNRPSSPSPMPGNFPSTQSSMEQPRPQPVQLSPQQPITPPPGSTHPSRPATRGHEYPSLPASSTQRPPPAVIDLPLRMPVFGRRNKRNTTTSMVSSEVVDPANTNIVPAEPAAEQPRLVMPAHVPRWLRRQQRQQ